MEWNRAEEEWNKEYGSSPSLCMVVSALLHGLFVCCIVVTVGSYVRLCSPDFYFLHSIIPLSIPPSHSSSHIQSTRLNNITK